MFTCNDHFSQTIDVKQSKFIAHLMPYAQMSGVLERLRAEHPKARHFVTAFRTLNEHDQIVEGSSDDGEPRGTSGKPALHVLQGHDLILVGVIVVRYFGGIKLGTGGLVRAYGDAVNAVVETALMLPYEKRELLVLRAPYMHTGRVEYAIVQGGAHVVSKEFEALWVRWHLHVSAAQKVGILATLQRIVEVEEGA
ncbi:MAG: YigZ family protein [Campylobacterales bacterium]|nr:YigZ family protein [Campylobacterales bacterium]